MKKRILLISIMLFIMTTYIFAAPDPNYIIRKGYSDDSYMRAVSDTSGNFNNIIGQITTILVAAGMGVGTCVGIIYAIMWITATPAKKAELKEKLFPLFLGIFLLFGGPSLAATIISGIAGILQ